MAVGLLDKHARWLRTVLRIRSGEPQVVEELWQDFAVAVLQKPPVHVAEERQPGWLYGAAVRMALLYRRQQGRRRQSLQRWQRQALAAPPNRVEPVDWLLVEERQQLVRDALDQLAPKDREVLLLKYSEDWTYQEMAQHLGHSETTIESRLHRARERLRQRLQGHFLESEGSLP